MNTRDPSPLDAEERAIAAQLARHAPAGAPAPELDAAVLAAAGAASGPTAAPPPLQRSRHPNRARRRRWPALTGVAASLALAAGIAWQLRPLPAPVPVQDEAASLPPVAFRTTADADSRPESTTAPAAAAASVVADTGLPVMPPTPGASDASDARGPAPTAQPAAAPIEATPQEHPAAAGAVEPAVGTADAPPASMTSPVQREAAAVSPAAPKAVSTAPGATAVGRQAMRGTRVPLRTAIAAADADSGMHTEPHAHGVTDEELDDSPPATVDSPEVHRAWLQRIRELRDSGRTDAARESLAELRRRFPELPVPGDLAALAEPAQ